MIAKEVLNEPILEDSHPIHFGYLYILENKDKIKTVIQSDIEDDVAILKEYFIESGYLNDIVIKRCDISTRKLWHLMV